MAAPHVAGVAALMKAVNPGLTPDQFDSLLSGGNITRDLGAPGRDDEFGYGLVDAYAAVRAAQADPTPVPAELVAAPNGLNFGTQGASATLSLVNAGSGTLSIVSVSNDAAWLTVGDATDTDTGLGTRTVTVNRAGLTADTYVAVISIVSTANTVTVPVIMQVDPDPAGADAGYHYVLLIDAATFDTRYQAEATATQGRYSYSITDVATGSYYVVAGSDRDNDNYICDPGEACGGYPTLDGFGPIDVSANVTGINFVTGADVAIQSQSGDRSGDRRVAPFRRR
jgi:serine protease